MGGTEAAAVPARVARPAGASTALRLVTGACVLFAWLAGAEGCVLCCVALRVA